MDLSFLPEEIRDKVYISDDEQLFLPDGELTGEEVYKKWLDDKDKQIDICPEPKPKTLEELTKENEQLWQTVEFLLKKTGMIGDDEDATT